MLSCWNTLLRTRKLHKNKKYKYDTQKLKVKTKPVYHTKTERVTVSNISRYAKGTPLINETRKEVEKERG